MGRPIGAGFARTLAAESGADLLERLKDGGEKMPAFGHLNDAEVEALLAYKVRVGKPVIMGVARMPSRGRMPVFDYLTEADVVGGYAYLAAYPPESGADPVPRIAAVRPQ
ncbi:MAG: hypothetical protein A3F70_07080 [Acidobacteria bacterium RIFCSPLOWO2_12_FULL_67_14]|nr:MAG: hypothetical protein A3H29_11320 [Acidobacteria bacterium RIFCSPLOWO2_02_FULL_67_21]OFW34817.1 MAG: hypothetical protein A3F70_07080 [Acidobacteria bacterium RIFCSPLOWO2_12_FULL_67_14]